MITPAAMPSDWISGTPLRHCFVSKDKGHITAVPFEMSEAIGDVDCLNVFFAVKPMEEDDDFQGAALLGNFHLN
jgi:predicted AlkP superfamily phosphohydrolase/phosphomutase